MHNRYGRHSDKYIIYYKLNITNAIFQRKIKS